MGKKYQQITATLVMIVLFMGVFSFQVHASNEKASITENTGYTVNRNDLCKIMSKKLGTPYSQMDCSAYAAWVLQNMGTKVAKEGAIKDIKVVAGRSSFDWEKKGALKISYKSAVYNKQKNKWVWSKTKKTVVNQSITTWKSLTQTKYKKVAGKLKVGDALIYNDHIALYFGEFDSASKVAAYLKEQCGMKGLKKSTTSAGNTCYQYKGKTVLVEYAECGSQWRIHATTSNGLIIDNDLTFHNGQYGGKWRANVRFVETTIE